MTDTADDLADVDDPAAGSLPMSESEPEPAPGSGPDPQADAAPLFAPLPAPEPGTEPDAEPEAGDLFIGREPQIVWVADALRAGGCVLVRGVAGIGKRALLRQVRERLQADGVGGDGTGDGGDGGAVCLWPPGTSRPKEFTFGLCEQVHAALGLKVPESLIPPRFRAQARRTGTVPFRHIRRGVARLTTVDQFELVLRSLDGRRDVVIFIESLDLPPTQLEMVERLLDTARVASSLEADPRRNRGRLQRLLWRFERTLELGPLSRTEVRAWVEQWLDAHPLHFERPRLREAFISAVCRDAAGVPAAVAGMLAAAAAEPAVSPETVRGLSHEAAVRYLDMTPLIIIAAAGFMALRYISRGTGMQELLVMAGVGTSLFWVVLYFARMMQAKR